MIQKLKAGIGLKLWKTTNEEKEIAQTIEGFRRPIKQLNKRLCAYESHKPGNFQRVSVMARALADVGISMDQGILLRRIAMAIKAKRILELGTNIGLSGCYFLSSPHTQKLVTVEGSKDLSEIAKTTLIQISPNFTVLNKFFREAFIDLKNKNEIFDCIYIDGEHNSVATFEYTKMALDLLRHNGAIIFDDIHWSDDMNKFWQEISVLPCFSFALDLGLKGLAIKSNDIKTN